MAEAPLRVLWITWRWDAPCRYRCIHAAMQLRRDGVPADVLDVDDPGLLVALPSYSVVVLYRLEWGPRVEAIVARARAVGATLVYESDDLIFDPSFEPLLPFLDDVPEADRVAYRRRFALCRAAFDVCAWFLGSTPVLVAHAERLGKRGLVHPNLVSPTYERTARLLVPMRRVVPPAPLIGYFSGSNTHDRDLAAIAAPLAEILARHPEAELLLCGFVVLPEALRKAFPRIRAVPFQDWRVYPWLLSRCRVALAPAAVANDFTDAKSALKFFEAGIFGVPVVASPTAGMRDAIDDGRNGLLATTPEGWLQRGARAHAGEARRLGEDARATVEARFVFAAHRGELRSLLERIAGRAAAPEPRRRALDGDPARTRGAARAREAWLRARARIALPRARPWTSLVWPPVVRDPGPLADPGAKVPPDATIRDAPSWESWQPSGDLVRDADGTFAARGDDARLESPPLALSPGELPYVALRMSATAATPTVAQLAWLPEGSDEFSDAHRACWPIDVSGTPRTYVLDLTAIGWPTTPRVRALRLDPLACEGTVRLERLCFRSKLPELPVRPSRAWRLRRRLADLVPFRLRRWLLALVVRRASYRRA